jgi:hypothetical protein
MGNYRIINAKQQKAADERKERVRLRYPAWSAGNLPSEIIFVAFNNGDCQNASKGGSHAKCPKIDVPDHCGTYPYVFLPGRKQIPAGV